MLSQQISVSISQPKYREGGNDYRAGGHDYRAGRVVMTTGQGGWS